MPLQATSGAASQDAFGGNGVAVVPTYIEDVFSTYLLLGNATTTTVNNGIDLSGKGGLVWLKDRTGAGYHSLADTARSGKRLFSNDTSAEVSSYPFAFTSTGFTANGNLLDSGRNFVTWTFRKQPKFFDIVTYTGTGSARTVAHNLGSVPGCIIVKKTSNADNWAVYHRSLTATDRVLLNTTGATAANSAYWNNTEPTSTNFTVNTVGPTNESGETYVAYLFAHNAGGFGLTGTDNVISCGSYTGTGAAGNAQTLGYEPQWILVKRNTSGYDWTLIDTMRGWATNGADAELYANSSSAEYFADNLIDVTATGFNFSGSATALNASGATYIYIAIRRGPMKVPTTGTSVFGANIGNNVSGSGLIANAGFPVDAHFEAYKDTTGRFWFDRLRGDYNYLSTASTAAETAAGQRQFANMSGAFFSGTFNFSSAVVYDFKRAPSFMDVVCYTGTGSATTVSHNLQAVPELMIVKMRSSTNPWRVYSAPTLATTHLALNTDAATTTSSANWNDTAPTSSVFTVGTGTGVNGSGGTYVNYLFATCAGVSKVGSYTGTATTKQIDCGFTAGARFVLIKRTDSTGDWYVWDTARGIVSGNDSYLLLNSTAAEVTSTDYIDTYSAGFEISSTAPAAINASGGTYIFLAIA